MVWLIVVMQIFLLILILAAAVIVFFHHFRFHYAAIFRYKSFPIFNDAGETIFIRFVLLAIEFLALMVAGLNHFSAALPINNIWIFAIVTPLVIYFGMELVAFVLILIMSRLGYRL